MIKIKSLYSSKIESLRVDVIPKIIENQFELEDENVNFYNFKKYDDEKSENESFVNPLVNIDPNNHIDFSFY